MTCHFAGVMDGESLREGTLLERTITDWDDAYTNAAYIPGGDSWPERWAAQAARFRESIQASRAELDLAYGEGPRNRLDLFRPERSPKGLVVFIHGGYWLKFDKSYWSHLAAGPLAHGFAVALPSYTLCPQNRISGITAEVARAIAFAAERVAGPIFLAGHSAGGHLVTRMISATSPLALEIQERIARTVSISGLHDLRPLMMTAMNEGLRLDDAEALAESPALLRPMPKARLIAWVGAAERSEFLRQNALIANIWVGLGASTAAVVEPDRHHFNIVDGLIEADHPLTRTLLTE